MTVPASALAPNRDLVLNLIRAELTARYRRTAGGLLWFVLSPLLLMVTLTIVFRHLVRLNIPNYPVFVLAGLLPWTFFQAGLTSSTTSLVRAAALVKRTRVPRALIPLSSIAANFVHFLVGLGLLLLLAPSLGVPLGGSLWLLPFAALLEATCLAGLALAAASLQVLFRDVEHLLAAGLRVLFYLTPIFYPLTFVPEGWRTLYLLNPVAGLVTIHRDLVLEGALPQASVVAMAAATSLAAVAVGMVVFARLRPRLDDYL